MLIPSEVMTCLLMGATTSFGTIVAIFLNRALHIEDWNVLLTIWSSSILISHAIVFKYYNANIAVSAGFAPGIRKWGFTYFLSAIWNLFLIAIFSGASFSVLRTSIENQFKVSINSPFSTIYILSINVYLAIFLDRWYKKYE